MKKSLLLLGVSLTLSSAVMAASNCPEAEDVARALYSNDVGITKIVARSVKGVKTAYLSNKLVLTLKEDKGNCHYHMGTTKLLTIIPSTPADK